MAAYADLTQVEKDVFESFERNLRASTGTLQRVLNGLSALKDQYLAQITAITAQLDPGETPPNTSGLAGSQPMAFDGVFADLVADMSSLLTNFNTDIKRQGRVKASGLNAGV